MAKEREGMWGYEDPCPKECEKCFALQWHIHGSYRCSLDYDEKDGVKMTDKLKPCSCKGIVNSSDELRSRYFKEGLLFHISGDTRKGFGCHQRYHGCR